MNGRKTNAARDHMSSAYIVIRHVTKKFKGETALSDVTLTMEKGKAYGISGNNGSGKTVLMKCVCGFLPVTEGEILDAIHRPLGAKSLDGIKRRTRAGMGRCQAGFCSPKTMEIIAREKGLPLESVTKSGKGSEIIQGRNKDRLSKEEKK